jgi:hypothetical protein
MVYCPRIIIKQGSKGKKKKRKERKSTGFRRHRMRMCG